MLSPIYPKKWQAKLNLEHKRLWDLNQDIQLNVKLFIEIHTASNQTSMVQCIHQVCRIFTKGRKLPNNPYEQYCNQTPLK